MAMGNSGGIHGHRRGNRRMPMAEINVTPLVDVMLVLLIIFMVTAPLLTAAVPLDLPESRANPVSQTQAEPITISMDAEGRIFIGEDEVDSATLPDKLAEIASPGPDGEEGPGILLRADRTLPYGDVATVMGEINRAGVTRLQLVTTGSVGGN